MPLEQAEIDRMLAGVPAPVRQAVEKRLSMISDARALADLIAAAELDEKLAPTVERAKKRDEKARPDEDARAAFDELWDKISRQIRNTIRVWIRCKAPEHIEAVESLARVAIWNDLPKYDRGKSFFLTWARGYAKNQALWYKCRTLGADANEADGPSAEDFFELPPSACYSELLDMVQDEDPCAAVAFLWNKYLDWKPAAIAETWGDTPLPKVIAAIQEEMVQRYPILMRVKASLAKLAGKALLTSKRTLRDCLQCGRELIESVTRWSGEVKRSLGSRIVSQAKDLLAIVCGLHVGAHERLAFIRNRFLRESLDKLYVKRQDSVVDLLEEFCSRYPGMTDLDAAAIAACTRPLRAGMEKAPARRLEDCSKGDLLADLAKWRDRIQTIALGESRDRHLLAYSYLCGALPGIDGPARKGV